MVTATDNLVTLCAGALELVVNPTLGGCIARFDVRDGDVLFPIFRGNREASNVLDAASFPLVPYVNRIRDGRFSFRGRTIQLAANMSGDPSPLHGQGWLSEWHVVHATDCHATIEFRHHAGEWPWTYRARQDFALDGTGLTITLGCTNLSSEPMPCGLGQHPYFHCTPATRLETQVRHVWTIDEKILPVDRIAATGRFDLGDRLVCGLGLDHGFGGWSARATVSDPAWPCRVIMSSPGTRFFQLYSPVTGDVFVIEPVTHANAALNEPEESWPELGMRILEPQATMSLTTRFEISTNTF